MNVDILSFVIIIAVDYILELRSGARAPAKFSLCVWGAAAIIIIIDERGGISGSWPTTDQTILSLIHLKS